MKVTRRRWTRRWKTGSPVLTCPSGYAALLGTRASYSNRPWCAYAASTVSVAVSGRPNEMKASPTHTRAATPSPISSGFSSSGTLRGARGSSARRGLAVRGCAPRRTAAPAPSPPPRAIRVTSRRGGAVQRLAQPFRRPGRRPARVTQRLPTICSSVGCSASRKELLSPLSTKRPPSTRTIRCRTFEPELAAVVEHDVAGADRRSAYARPRGRRGGASAPSSCRR